MKILEASPGPPVLLVCLLSDLLQPLNFCLPAPLLTFLQAVNINSNSNWRSFIVHTQFLHWCAPDRPCASGRYTPNTSPNSIDNSKHLFSCSQDCSRFRTVTFSSTFKAISNPLHLSLEFRLKGAVAQTSHMTKSKLGAAPERTPSVPLSRVARQRKGEKI